MLLEFVGISSHIIAAYLATKKGTDEKPLSERTLYRILNVWLKLKPSRALSGLDNYKVIGWYCEIFGNGVPLEQ